MAGRLDDPARIRALERLGMADATGLPALESLAGLARELLDVPVVLVSMVDDHRQVFKAAPGLAEPWSSRRQTGLSHSFCRVVATTAEALVIEDSRADDRVRDNLAIEDIGVVAYAGMPVHDPDGRVLGSFCAIDGDPRAWSDRELVALRGFADVAERIIAEQPVEVAAHGSRALLEDLRFARRLQRALLPRRHSAALARRVSSAYQPGSDRLLLGGDFIDVFEHADGQVGFVLGDVCGHGPESAAFALALRSAWSTLEGAQPDLSELTEAWNASAVNLQPPDDPLFATALLGRMSSHGHAASLLSAGHPAPILLAEQAVEVRLPTGMVIGLPGAFRWQPAEVDVPAGGLLAYTDGLVEGLRSGAGGGRERWGLDGLLESLADHHLAGGAWDEGLLGHLIRDATRAHGDELPDDVALLRIQPAG